LIITILFGYGYGKQRIDKKKMQANCWAILIVMAMQWYNMERIAR